MCAVMTNLYHEPVYGRRGYGYIGLEKLAAYGFTVIVLFLSHGQVVKPHSGAMYNATERRRDNLRWL